MPLATLLPSLLALSALFGQNRSAGQVGGPVFPPRPGTPDPARLERYLVAAKQATARCGPVSGCPEGIALWTKLEPKGPPSQCTSFLVAPDLALTNHHCIPASTRNAGGDCRNLAWLHFPKTGSKPADTVSCREVVAISATSDKIDQPDWALVRLARPMDRAILPVSTAGVRDLDSLVAWSFNPDWALLALRERIAAELRPLDCRASRRTKAFKDPGSVSEYSDSLSRRIPLASCPAQKGNSGAPLLRRGPDGIWRIHALLDRSAPVNGVRDWVRSQGLELLDPDLGEFAYATNLSCVPLPGRQTLPEICGRDSNTATIQADYDNWKAEVDLAISEKARQVAPHRPMAGAVLQRGVWSGFSKRAVRCARNTEAVVIPLPACSSPSASDSLFHVPVWGIRFGFDKDLRWSFRMDPERPRLAVREHCEPLGSPDAGIDICRFEARFPRIGTIPLRTDTLARCVNDRTAGTSRRSLF